MERGSDLRREIRPEEVESEGFEAMDDRGHWGCVVESGNHALVRGRVQSTGSAVPFGGRGAWVGTSIERTKAEATGFIARSRERSAALSTQSKVARSGVEKGSA